MEPEYQVYWFELSSLLYLCPMTPEEHYHHIADQLPDIKKGKMFGALCIKTENNGKAAALFRQDHMVFKLRGEAESEALSLDGTTVFAPAKGREMKGWIQVPFDYVDRWEAFTKAAIDYVKTIKTIEKKK